jgi:DNA-directed RNA polymerase specialized sigma24 family protein
MAASIEPPRGGFPSTHWSEIQVAGHGDVQARRAALEALIPRYMPALRSHLLYARRLNPHEAEDVLQAFLADKVLEQNLIARAEPEKGRFRNFLLVTLDRFMLNRLRALRVRTRMLDPTCVDGRDLISSDQPPPQHVFDVEWARQVIAQAVEKMKAHCLGSGRPDIWGVFEGRTLGPILSQSEPVSYQQLVETYGFVSPSQASNVLITANRMFIRYLREVVGAYASDPQEIDEEIRDLRHILTQARAGQ